MTPVTATKHPVEAAPAAPVHLNRELSQLDLIRRVLDLAADRRSRYSSA